MNVTRLQDLSDAEFTQLVKMHTAHLSTLVQALQEHQLVNGFLQEEARRRAAAMAAVPNQVRSTVQAIMDKAR